MRTVEVGLGDSPMLIAKKFTGDRRRYQELITSNPHKSVVFVGGLPTFASLGVGETLNLPSSFGVGDIPFVPSISALTPAQVRAALPQKLQAAWDSHVADYNSSSAAQAGVNAALTLASGEKIDNQKIVHAFSGAVASVPVVGTVMAGLAEFFYKYGPDIGNAFGNLFGLVHCNKDDRSPETWIKNARISPAPNTFAAVVVPMLALAWSDYVACNQGQHGIGWKPCSQIIPAAVMAWNSIAGGETIDYFVPQINSAECGFLNFMSGTHSDSGFLVRSDQGPYAFLPVSRVPQSMLVGEGLYWARVKAKAGPVVQPAAPSAAAVDAMKTALAKAQPPPAPKKAISLHVGPAPAPAPALPSAADIAAMKAALAKAPPPPATPSAAPTREYGPYPT